MFASLKRVATRWGEKGRKGMKKRGHIETDFSISESSLSVYSIEHILSQGFLLWVLFLLNYCVHMLWWALSMSLFFLLLRLEKTARTGRCVLNVSVLFVRVYCMFLQSAPNSLINPILETRNLCAKTRPFLW